MVAIYSYFMFISLFLMYWIQFYSNTASNYISILHLYCSHTDHDYNTTLNIKWLYFVRVVLFKPTKEIISSWKCNKYMIIWQFWILTRCLYLFVICVKLEDKPVLERTGINQEFTFELFICATILLEHRETLLKCRNESQLIHFANRCVWV